MMHTKLLQTLTVLLGLSAGDSLIGGKFSVPVPDADLVNKLIRQGVEIRIDLFQEDKGYEEENSIGCRITSYPWSVKPLATSNPDSLHRKTLFTTVTQSRSLEASYFPCEDVHGNTSTLLQVVYDGQPEGVKLKVIVPGHWHVGGNMCFVQKDDTPRQKPGERVPPWDVVLRRSVTKEGPNVQPVIYGLPLQ